MIPILYFHGFASSPGSAKIELLRGPLRKVGLQLHSPDLNVPSFATLDFDGMVAMAISQCERLGPRVVVGSSLGSIVALATRTTAPLVLIAPALGVAQRWKSRIPDGDPVLVFNHALGTDAPIHRAFFEQMATVTVDDEPPISRVTAIMGRNDETIPYDHVESEWLRWEASGKLVPGSKWIEIPDGDHSLTAHTDRIAAEIVEAAQ